LEKFNNREIQEFFKDKGIEIDGSTIARIRNNTAKRAERWYAELRKSRYLYIAHQKERIDTLYKAENKLWIIANDQEAERTEQVKALSEIHKIEITLSNLYDIVRYLTSTFGRSTNNESVHTEGPPEGTGPVLSTESLPAIE
jgi:hypothetical protein